MQTTSLAALQPPLYEDVRAFDLRDGDTRIFAPTAYALVRNAQIVPIVHSEALGLAHWFPICWLITNDGPGLVALRSLRSDGTAQPSGSPESVASLPLVLRAYPFVVGIVGGADAQHEHHLDFAIPDRPSDVGAPIMTTTGKAASGTLMKLQAQAAFNHALPLSRAMTEHLAVNDLLEPWPLTFDLSDTLLEVKRLFVVSPDKLSSPKMFQFIEEFGPIAATLIGAHRISLFRAGILLQAAKNATVDSTS